MQNVFRMDFMRMIRSRSLYLTILPKVIFIIFAMAFVSYVENLSYEDFVKQGVYLNDGKLEANINYQEMTSYERKDLPSREEHEKDIENLRESITFDSMIILARPGFFSFLFFLIFISGDFSDKFIINLIPVKDYERSWTWAKTILGLSYTLISVLIFSLIGISTVIFFRGSFDSDPLSLALYILAILLLGGLHGSFNALLRLLTGNTWLSLIIGLFSISVFADGASKYITRPLFKGGGSFSIYRIGDSLDNALLDGESYLIFLKNIGILLLLIFIFNRLTERLLKKRDLKLE